MACARRGRGVNGRKLYRGHALQAVDAKGRVALPADLRNAFKANSPTEDSLLIGKSTIDPCLIAHDVEWSQIMGNREAERQQRRLDAGEEIDPRALRNLHARYDSAKLDDSARFILTPYFRDRAKIGKWAFFMGAANEMEIWAPEVLIATETVDEELRDICRWLCEQRGVEL